MAVLSLDVYSYELGMNNQVTMILPERRGVPVVERNGKPYPVLYLLHGHGLDHTGWLRMTQIEHLLRETDVIVVMPNGNRGCFVDGFHTHRYGTYLTEELPKRLGNWFNLSTRREDNFISGFSMGGYGALRAAFANPDKYAAVAAISPCIDMHKLADVLPADAPQRGIAFPPVPEIGRNFTEIFGDDDVHADSALNLENLAKALQKNGANGLRTMTMCGDRDPLWEMNENFARFMKCECPDVPFAFVPGEGMHTVEYWNGAIPGVLRFFGLL